MSGHLRIVSSSQGGTEWLDSFIAQCENCTYSFLATHFYGQSFSSLQSYLTTLHSKYPSYPIWLTEFGFPQVSSAAVVASLNETIAFLDSTEWVARYAYFPIFRSGEGNAFIGQTGAVWDENGDITEVGKVWLGLNETPSVLGNGSNTTSGGNGGMVVETLSWCFTAALLASILLLL